jgi:hypothetical protein
MQDESSKNIVSEDILVGKSKEALSKSGSGLSLNKMVKKDRLKLGELFPGDLNIINTFNESRLYDVTHYAGYKFSFKPVINKDYFLKNIEKFYSINKDPLSSISATFLGNKNPHIRKFHVKSGDIVLTVGDLHSKAYSFIRILARWRRMGYIDEKLKVKKNVKIIFLGDYADRWKFGVEIYDTIIRMAILNPENVILLKGNHESLFLAASKVGDRFLGEIEEKYGKETRIKLAMPLNKFWSFLPSAALICFQCGSKIMLNHGGFPTYEKFINVLKAFLNNEEQTVIEIDSKHDFALLWNDYIAGKDIIASPRGRDIYEVGIDLVEELCKELGIKNIFRAHQHNNSVTSVLSGKGKWESIQIAKEINLSSSKNFVYTIMGCTEGLVEGLGEFEGVYGFCELKVGKKYDDSTIMSYQYKLPAVSMR